MHPGFRVPFITTGNANGTHGIEALAEGGRSEDK